MIGRGTRLHPGKDHLLVLDVRDVTTGKSMFEAAKKYAELDALSSTLAEQSLTPEAVERNLQLAIDLIRAHELDLLQREEQAQAVQGSPFMWCPVSTRRFEVTPDAGETTYLVYRTGEAEDAPWGTAVRHSGGHRALGEVFPSAAAAISAADRHIAQRHRGTKLIDREAAWTRDPASEKQLATLIAVRRPHRPEHDQGRGQPAPQRPPRSEAVRDAVRNVTCDPGFRRCVRLRTVIAHHLRPDKP